MTDERQEQRFNQAVQLAGAFVANGDIRLMGSTREDSEAMHMLVDLIGSLYVKLGEAHDAAGVGT